jgi:archaemetzincin
VRRLLLIAVGEVPPHVLSHLREFLPRAAGLPCEVDTTALDPQQAYVQQRGQLDARRVLAMVEQRAQHLHVLGMGVADLDLFSSVFTHVFGEAQLRGVAAAFSLHRLRPELYGLPPDDALLLARARREALHELGHLLGLTHCALPDCVMRFSTGVEEVDLKGDEFCDTCNLLARAVR